MKPLKSLVPIAKWLLRIAFAVIAYIGYFDNALAITNNAGLDNIIAFIVVVLAVLLLVGGFLNKASLTVISGLLIVFLFVFLMFYDGISIDSILEKITPAAIGFYFMARGNLG